VFPLAEAASWLKLKNLGWYESPENLTFLAKHAGTFSFAAYLTIRNHANLALNRAVHPSPSCEERLLMLVPPYYHQSDTCAHKIILNG
jgi:hypothetical protein